ncbi:hypothetical protein ECE50_000090 [Chitinophaga sp. Mgbs1]|uniref:Uncharacterized protein n=1 Tax=Chitinophaga solisilvae TaxID=1233460 RepID=A0A433WE31_9BACT|nr:hypothetical protein [Chitinophaga solisilvae]
MYNVKSKFSLYCWLMLLACSRPDNTLEKPLQALDPAGPANGSYVIIPNQGCEGCISTAESFVKNHISSAADIRYVFTRIQSVKLLKIKLGATVMASDKVLLDTANTIPYPDKQKEIYPMIVRVKNHKVTEITYQSPESDGFADLLKR